LKWALIGKVWALIGKVLVCLPREEGCHPTGIAVTAKTGVVKKSVSIFIVGQAAKDKCS